MLSRSRDAQHFSTRACWLLWVQQYTYSDERQRVTRVAIVAVIVFVWISSVFDVESPVVRTVLIVQRIWFITTRRLLLSAWKVAYFLGYLVSKRSSNDNDTLVAIYTAQSVAQLTSHLQRMPFTSNVGESAWMQIILESRFSLFILL